MSRRTLKDYIIPIRRCRCRAGAPRGVISLGQSAARHAAKLQKPVTICVNKTCKADLREVTSPTAGLRFHALRHRAITELAEGQASEQTIRSIAGHVSTKMLEQYSHIRLDAKRTALDALSQGKGTGGYGTNNDTNELPAPIAYPQVIERMVDERGFEPPASSLRTRRSPS